MKYSPQMLEAHEKTLWAYSDLVEFVADEGTTYGAAYNALVMFYTIDCNYCKTGLCRECVLSGYFPTQQCINGVMLDSYLKGSNLSRFKTRQQIINALTKRFDALVLQAEFNLSKEDE